MFGGVASANQVNRQFGKTKVPTVEEVAERGGEERQMLRRQCSARCDALSGCWRRWGATSLRRCLSCPRQVHPVCAECSYVHSGGLPRTRATAPSGVFLKADFHPCDDRALQMMFQTRVWEHWHDRSVRLRRTTPPLLATVTFPRCWTREPRDHPRSSQSETGDGLRNGKTAIPVCRARQRAALG